MSAGARGPTGGGAHRPTVLAVGLTAMEELPCLGTGFVVAHARAQADLAAAANLEILHASKYAPDESLLRRILAVRPRIVAFTAQHAVLGKIGRLARVLKAVDPEVAVLVGGTEVHGRCERVLRDGPGIDFAVDGEGELAFAALLRHLLGGARPGRSACDVANVAWRRDGEVVVNPKGPVVADLDSLPSPYLTGVLEVAPGGLVHLETYRGCPYRCRFCYEGRGFQGLRSFSHERILDEIRHVVRAGARRVKFYDTVFNYDRKRLERICDGIAALGGGVFFGAEGLAEIVDEASARALARAGFRQIEFGLQTTNEATLQRMGRSMFDRAKFERGVALVLEHGVRPFVHVMGALPGDSFADSLRTLDYVVDLGASPGIFHTKILPGTPLAQDASVQAFPFEPHNVLATGTYAGRDAIEWLVVMNVVVLWDPYSPLFRWMTRVADRPFSRLVLEFGAWLDRCRQAGRPVLGAWTDSHRFASDFAGPSRPDLAPPGQATPATMLAFLSETAPAAAQHPDLALLSTALEQCYLYVVAADQGLGAAPPAPTGPLTPEARLVLEPRLRTTAYDHDVFSRVGRDPRPLDAAEVRSLPPMRDKVVVSIERQDGSRSSVGLLDGRVFSLLGAFRSPQLAGPTARALAAGARSLGVRDLPQLLGFAVEQGWLVVLPGDAAVPGTRAAAPAAAPVAGEGRGAARPRAAPRTRRRPRGKA